MKNVADMQADSRTTSKPASNPQEPWSGLLIALFKHSRYNKLQLKPSLAALLNRKFFL